MTDQLKIQLQATLSKTQIANEIKKQIKEVQGLNKVELGFEIKDKQALKSYEQMQTALSQTVIKQRKELEAVERKQAQATNKYLDQEYAKRLKNLEIERQSSLKQFNSTKQTNQGNWDNRFKESVSGLTAQNTELKKWETIIETLKKK